MCVCPDCGTDHPCNEGGDEEEEQVIRVNIPFFKMVMKNIITSQK